MAMIARYPVLALRHFVFLCALWTWNALPASVHAGFELTLDSESVRTIDGHYAIDVLLTTVGDPQLDINGIITTLKSPNAGLVFLKIAPSENGSIFGAASYWPNDDESASTGNPEETWTSSVYLSGDNTIRPPESGVVFRLEFSVPGDGPYAIQFVNSDSEFSDEKTQYSYPAGDGFEFGDFDALNSSNFVVSTPEPSSLALLTLALGGLSVWRGRAMRCRTKINDSSTSSPIKP